MLKYFANTFWVNAPSFFQKEFSRIFSRIFKTKFSRLFIFPYCLFYGLNSDYLNQFEPESGNSSYPSYSDFFQRKYKQDPNVEGNIVWPCEGFLCDWGLFSNKKLSVVKGQTLDLNSIFDSQDKITKDYFFVNVFLHNHNYHRVHSPIGGKITKITKIPGDLVFLRPWFYKRSNVSYPAFRNERIVFEIIDFENRPWYMAMVGGFGVGTIDISREFLNGGEVKVGQQIAKFNLGSTVCVASPINFEVRSYLETVRVGQKISTSMECEV